MILNQAVFKSSLVLIKLYLKNKGGFFYSPPELKQQFNCLLVKEMQHLSYFLTQVDVNNTFHQHIFI